MTSPNQQEESGLQDCPCCSNSYLAIRKDVYKDKREFIYCDVCGCLADRRVWNRIGTKPVPADALHLARSRIEELEEALERISRAKPDRLDHALDVAIIERAASVARSVLNKEQKA